MKYEPIITKTAMIFDLQKPIYGSHFGIWDKWILIAKKRKLNMIVNTPFGKATYTYKEYMDGAVKKERYYKNLDVPMIFWCRDFLPDIQAREERKKREEKENAGYTNEGINKLLQAYKDSLKHI